MVFLLSYALWQSHRREMTGRVRTQPEIDFTRFPPTEYSLTTVASASETDDA